MAVYFVYRCPYEGPSERSVHRYPDATVLGWFQERWEILREQGYDSGDLPGTHVYGFGSLGDAVAEHDLPVPDSPEALRAVLEEHLYVEGEILFEEHCLQVSTDDDELQMAYYFFDDPWVDAHPGVADLLLHEGWQLPAEIARCRPFVPEVEPVSLGKGPGGEGRVWITSNRYDDGENLGTFRPLSVEGARLRELPAWLLLAGPDRRWPLELLFLRSQLLAPPPRASERELELLRLVEARPDDAGAWSVYSDWLMEQGRPPAPQVVLSRAMAACIERGLSRWAGRVHPWPDALKGSLPEARAAAEALVARHVPEADGRSRGRSTEQLDSGELACSEHLAQMYLLALPPGEIFPGIPSRETYHQWILFDDVWAGAHPSLANGVMRYVSRWDVLTAD